MKSIAIVTAFFDIGRENFKAIPRTNKKYIDNFRFWARIKNHLVIYTQPQFAEAVRGIRNEFGLEDKTTIIVVNDIKVIEPNIFSEMKKVGLNRWFERFRVIPNATSNIPLYSYMMLLKNWFVKDAVEKDYIKGAQQVAWIDFGFNKGGNLYTNPEDFDFEWKYDFKDKIHLMYLKQLDEKPIFEIVRRLSDCITGGNYALPSSLAETFWQLTRSSMLHLLATGLYDDDQTLLLMAYRAKPELFEMHKSSWFRIFLDFSDHHFEINEGKKIPVYKKIWGYCGIIKKRLYLSFRQSFIVFYDYFTKK